MSDDGSDVEMLSAVSRQVPTNPPLSRVDTPQSTVLDLPGLNSDVPRPPSPMIVDEPVATKPSFDLLHRIHGMYRLLDLVQERGSGGVVDKIIIAQDSIQTFANKVHKGSYRSDIQVDFKALDQHVIKPRGIYGSASAIVNFLKEIGCVDGDDTPAWLLRPRDEYSGVSYSTLRPGIYLVEPPNDDNGLVYIVFWPEDATWQDGAISSVSRNRVTFMRYLSKLCDQIDCLISPEHADQLVWKDDTAEVNDDEYNTFDDRMFGYTVTETNEEEESAQAEDGFVMRHHSVRAVERIPEGYPSSRTLHVLQPRLVVGETSQCILETQYIPEETRSVKVDENLKMLALRDMLNTTRNPTVLLNPRMDPSGLQIILEHGIWERCGSLRADWEAQVARDKTRREEDNKAEKIARRKATASDKSELDLGMKFWLAKQAATSYPIIPELSLFQAIIPDNAVVEQEQCEIAIAKVESWLAQYPTLSRKLIRNDYFVTLESNPRARYNMLKRQLLQVLQVEREDLILSGEDIQRLADIVTARDEATFQNGVNEVLGAKKQKPWLAKKLTKLFWGGGGGGGPQTRSQDATLSLPSQDDPSFARTLESLGADRPQFLPAIKELQTEIIKLLRGKIQGLSYSLPEKLVAGLQDEISEEIRTKFDSLRAKERVEAWQALHGKVQEYLELAPQRKNSPKLTIDSVARLGTNNHYPQQTFHIKGTISTPTTAAFQYILRPIYIKADDMNAISSNPDHICRPLIRTDGTQPISLAMTMELSFIQLIEKDQALVIIKASGEFRVYIDSIDCLSSAISQRNPIKTFYSEKLGNNPLFALDETRRSLAIFAISGTSVHLHVYAYDLNTKSLNLRGTPDNLTRWYPQAPTVTHLLFVSGAEELLVVERGGSCRIFSLVTANFRPSTLRLTDDPESVFSSPDGACLLVKVMGADGPRLFCYHWASFGSNEGTEIFWPSHVPVDSPMVVSSLGHRQSTHIIFMARRDGFCQSLRVRITSKSSEYAFRSNLNNNGGFDPSANTVNNSLIDCHAEMWTRFPVNAAIVKATVANALCRPRTVLFIANTPLDRFAPYFDAMIRDFEYKTRKPTKDLLKQIKVTAARDWKATSMDIQNSEFQTGDWLVGLFCLIPIHLAVTRSNRFIPLKDGVDSPRFEHSLLGANVAQISEALSFGWYESIFSSYLASQPVKVVTSMGEQSVGKSFALNHFVDTSFAGSAMRCTEGVWLSVTPTKDYLVVALDFEGEPNEDWDIYKIIEALQGYILSSDLARKVLFRNNFALSRDITGLFNSFQSCTKVLDPASNPSLFHSTLGIIIKDVIDSDTREIVQEFQQKFQRIVQKERADNFISKLHRGKLDIIPWPVIESARFYDLFMGLKKRLDRQPITHKHAGAFLGVLKMLMAKLKANDWGALDQNLAIQRAQQLNYLLPTALAFGTTDPANGELLKNYDTDEPIGDNNSAIFFVEGVSQPTSEPLSLNSCLEQLRMGWQHLTDRYSGSMSERQFVDSYNGYLRELADARIGRVQIWIEVNTSRFGEQAEVTALRRTFDQLSKELRVSVVLCGSKCTLCGLLCLEHKQHDGDHNCSTNHKCPEPCGFADQHEEEEVVGCDLPAGHVGRHVCAGTPHLCGMQCQMFGRNGCLKHCTKPNDHDENDGHECAASMHTCGELCSLVQDDGYRLCSRPCTLDCRINHEKHQCDRSLSCPRRCQLCNSYCAAGDHFHALEPDAVHLCGQQHNCKHDCELAGVCEIKTTPQSIESTFVGKHATFQYTKYSQEGGKLPCIIPIAPDQLEHDGHHVHSNDRDPFHYCTERCKHCEYYCTLPLGHVQPEHSTNHGSMAETQWFVEGDEDATLVLQGRKYATGDSGAPMLCSLLCETQGRHVHIDNCRPDEDGQCIGTELQHINRPGEDNDWITHRLFWARSGFKDPYSQEKQDDFVLCDHKCGGQEHDADENNGAVPSFCTLPLFHGTPDPNDAPPLGHVSHDGHAYQCKNPALMQRSFQIFFVLDQSGSMACTDRHPLPNSPATQRIVQLANNRFGAVISSLYGFWTAREAAVRGGANAGQRRDAYSIISFDHTAVVTLSNDMTSDSDELLEKVLRAANRWGGTNYTAALQTVQAEMEHTWASDRSPVVIFLSDGECAVEDSTVYDLCRAASRLGKTLAFHAVSFGQDGQTHYLRRMAQLAGEVYDSGPIDPLAPAGVNPCSFSSALDTVQLATTFLSLAESLKNPRAALSRVH